MNFKKIYVAAAAVALMGASGAASAIPHLQLGILGGTYDTASQTGIASDPKFDLYAFCDTDKPCTGTHYISVALVGTGNTKIDTAGTYGSFTTNFSGSTTTVNVTGSDFKYGFPPLEAAIAKDPGDLASHGIYATYYLEYSFTFGTTECNDLNAQDDPDLSGLTCPGTGMKAMHWSFDTTNMAAGYFLHFDLYNEVIKTGDIDVDKFAPFSHDAQSSSTSGTSTTGDVPEPNSSSLALLGLAMLGTAFGLRRRKLNG